ncbi:MAG: metalloregulator ArsR/SmtB family transcription factor [Thermoanaerobaculia bacterium]
MTASVHELLARFGRALAAPARIAIMDVLAQAPRSVEDLAAAIGQSVANTSQHLRILREVRLVNGTRDGLRITYRLASDDVAALLVGLRQLGEAQMAELRLARQAIAAKSADVACIDRNTLRRLLRAGEVLLIDVRPAEEFAAAHLPGAISVPVAELDSAIASLPKRIEIVAYCRGPYCMLAVEAVRAMKRLGRKARRLEDGVTEWRSAGLPIVGGLTVPPSSSKHNMKRSRSS